jgi:hypothetical protein
MASTSKSRNTLASLTVYVPLEILVVLFWSLLYFEGAGQALSNGTTSIYEIQINTSFVLAGFGIAATVLARDSDRHLFLVPTILFLVSGLLMFANLVVPEFQAINYSTATPTQKGVFYFVAGTGAIGSFVFFSALASLITNLIRWYREQTIQRQ